LLYHFIIHPGHNGWGKKGGKMETEKYFEKLDALHVALHREHGSNGWSERCEEILAQIENLAE
jgi:hypothetical protein